MPEQKDLNLLFSQLEKISNRNYSPKVKIVLVLGLVVISSFAGSIITSTLIKPQAQNFETIPQPSQENTYLPEKSAQGVEYRVLRR